MSYTNIPLINGEGLYKYVKYNDNRYNAGGETEYSLNPNIVETINMLIQQIATMQMEIDMLKHERMQLLLDVDTKINNFKITYNIY